MTHQPDPGAMRPLIRYLSDPDRARLHEAVIHILEKIGMRVLHEGALDLLAKAGCPKGADGRVRLPRALVEHCLGTAPKSVPVFDREGNPAMDLGGFRSYFGTGSDLFNVWDTYTGERRRCALEDVRRAAHLCDGLPNIDFIMSSAHPQDIAPSRAYLASFVTMVENCVKPPVMCAENGDDLTGMYDVSVILRGGEQALREKPHFVLYLEPITPLQHPVESVAKLLFCAEKGIPAIYSPAPLSGSTAPMTLAGHLALGLAECFFGLVMHQLARPGAPFIMGVGTAVLDMVSMQCSYNAPEYYMPYCAMIEMAHHYDLPSWGINGCSDSQVPDGQATFEAGLSIFLSCMAGANLNHDIGYLDFGQTGSLELIAICDEMVSIARRYARGVPVTDETLALDVIEKVGPGGFFLTEPHTVKHVRGTQWRPRLFSRDSFENWTLAGRKDLLARARDRVQGILSGHAPKPLAPEKLAAVRGRLAAFRPELA